MNYYMGGKPNWKQMDKISTQIFTLVYAWNSSLGMTIQENKLQPSAKFLVCEKKIATGILNLSKK